MITSEVMQQHSEILCPQSWIVTVFVFACLALFLSRVCVILENCNGNKPYGFIVFSSSMILGEVRVYVIKCVSTYSISIYTSRNVSGNTANKIKHSKYCKKWFSFGWGGKVGALITSVFPLRRQKWQKKRGRSVWSWWGDWSLPQIIHEANSHESIMFSIVWALIGAFSTKSSCCDLFFCSGGT